MVPPVSRSDQRALGSRANTIWGVATIMSVAPNGGYMCSWPHLKEEFQMEFFSDNEPIPEGSRRGPIKEIYFKILKTGTCGVVGGVLG